MGKGDRAQPRHTETLLVGHRAHTDWRQLAIPVGNKGDLSLLHNIHRNQLHMDYRPLSERANFQLLKENIGNKKAMV